MLPTWSGIVLLSVLLSISSTSSAFDSLFSSWFLRGELSTAVNAFSFEYIYEKVILK